MIFFLIDRKPVRRVTQKRPYKMMKALAAVMVPAHGIIGTVGLSSNGGYSPMRTQIKTFFMQLVRGCAWAAAIAAGMLIYTTFTAKWKERGFPTIPISALVAAEQMSQSRGGIPLGPSGPGMYNGGRQTTTQSSTATTRQTSFLDIEEFQG